jgi:phosphohistidine swiveling domain-containing protein
MTIDRPDQPSIRPAAAALIWDPPDPGEWEFDASHQAEPASATLQELFPPAVKAGFVQAFALYGLPLSHMEVRFVNGWAYISPFVHGAPRKGSGKPPPAIVLKILTRLPPSARRRIKAAAAAIDNDAALGEIERWEQMRASWIGRNLEFQDVDLEACSDAELAEQVRSTAAHFGEGATHHFALLSQVIPVGEYLVRTGEWGISPKVAGKAAFHGVPTTREGRRRLMAIGEALGDTVVHDLDQVRTHSEQAAAALDDYLRHHGSWVLSDDIVRETLAELPDLVLRTIERHRHGVYDEQPDIDAAAAMCRKTVPASERASFDRLLTRAQRAHAALDDNSGLLASWPGGLARRAQIEAAGRLVDRGVLAVRDDVFVLRPGEIADLVTGVGGPGPDEIAERLVIREAQASVAPPAHLGSPPSATPDAGLFPAPVGQHVRHFGAYLAAKFGDASASVIGVGEAPVTARAVVAVTPSDALDRVEPGDVLVTTFTTPAFNVIMPILGGIVTISGGANCHTAVVARELGIPAVIGVADALDRIPDGALVTVDPVTATVTLAEPAR